MTGRAAAAAAFVLALLIQAAPAGAQTPDQLVPVPDMYYGSWSRHGGGLTITPIDGLLENATAIAQWRTYTWCDDPATRRTNPPPCDSMVGDLITNGGLASLAFYHPYGQDDRRLSALVVATSDPGGPFGKAGGRIEFTMLPGNMLQLEGPGGPTMFCGPNTDLSLYPPLPCGA